jgi:Bacterial alpha-L-rhamnosidase 6 hairpin glycosidase domain
MLISQRTLRFGPHTLLAADAGRDVVPYFLAGRKMYYVGMTTGDMQPIGAEHLVGEMGGLWAHPIKVADGLTLLISDNDAVQPMAHSIELIELLSHLEWRYRLGGMEIKRRDFIVEDQAAFVSLLTLKNAGARQRSGRLHLNVWLKFMCCWFGGQPTGGGEYWLEDRVVLGYDRLWQGRWGVACGTTVAPAECIFEPRPIGQLATLIYPYTLGPGASETWEFVLTADHQHGHEGARRLFGQVAGSGERLLTAKLDYYHQRIFGGVTLETPDKGVNRSFTLAKANLQLLAADNGAVLPPYFLGGVPEYPQLFGCDTAYTVPGAVAAGFVETARSALLGLADYGGRACGRIPHEVTTNGRVFHPGNTQETPQFAAACWDYFRWTGDIAFLRQVYGLCKEGIDEYMPAIWGGGGAPYPIGDGMVERSGMGACKLDSTCYLFDGLRALRDMAAALELPDDARRYGAHLEELGRRFEHDWWLEDESMYADSLHRDGRPQFDGHWTVVLPLQLGLASEERAPRALERIEREWVNQWGLVHTQGREELVWTLPTGLLALTAFRYGQPSLGVRLLENIAATASYGTLGAFKELIPIGLCFVQLWSAGLYLQGMLEGLVGLRPYAYEHRLALSPRLPVGWPWLRVNELMVGEHRLALYITPSSLDIAHSAGPASLDLRYHLSDDAALAPPVRGYGPPPEEITDAEGRWLRVVLAPGQRALIEATHDGVRVHVPDRREELAGDGIETPVGVGDTRNPAI